MRLKQEIEHTRALETGDRNPPYATQQHAVSLRVETSGGETWVLPWDHFVFGRHQEVGERDQLVLTFVAHEVAIGGMNLGDMIPAVVRKHLESLRPAPGKYLKSSGDQPFIAEIQVRSVDEHRVIH